MNRSINIQLEQLTMAEVVYDGGRIDTRAAVRCGGSKAAAECRCRDRTSNMGPLRATACRDRTSSSDSDSGRDRTSIPRASECGCHL